MSPATILEHFRAQSPKRQIVLVAAVAALFAALLLAVWLAFLRTSYQPLFKNLEAGDAAVIVAELDRKKIPYRLADGGATILVAEDRLDSTRLNVLTQDLPLKGTVGFELFNKSDMGLTDFAQKINYQRALQGELARTIMTLDGVESARVHLSMGEDRIFRDDRVPPKASVTIHMKHGVQLSARAAQGVQRLIAAAVPKLDVADVVVLDEAGQVVAGTPAASRSMPARGELAAVTQYYASRVRMALGTSYPADKFDVAVNVQRGAEEASLAFDEGNPQARTFPLQIMLTPEAALNGASQESVRAVVTSALGTARVNDTIVFEAPDSFTLNADEGQTAFSPAAERPLARLGEAASRVAPIASDDGISWAVEALASLLVLAILVGAFLFLVRRARGQRRLSDAELKAFAERLRAAVQHGDENVASET